MATRTPPAATGGAASAAPSNLNALLGLLPPDPPALVIRWYASLASLLIGADDDPWGVTSAFFEGLRAEYLPIGQALECGARPLVAGDVGERALVRVRRVREAGAYTIGQSIASNRLLH